MVGAKAKKIEEDNSYMFKRLTSHNPLVYDSTPNPKAFEDWIQGIEKLFDALQCLKEWRIRFAVFYLKDEADLWWATMQQR